MVTNYYRAGLGNVGSFQSSGIPWCSSSVTCPASGAAVLANRIDFPYVSRTVVIRNDGAATIRVGFSDAGVRGIENAYYFTLAQNNSLELDFKVRSVFLYSDSAGAGLATVVAGLTGIDPSELQYNWTGNAGVG